MAVHYPHLGRLPDTGETAPACSWEPWHHFSFYGNRINHPEHFFQIPLVFWASEVIKWWLIDETDKTRTLTNAEKQNKLRDRGTESDQAETYSEIDYSYSNS